MPVQAQCSRSAAVILRALRSGRARSVATCRHAASSRLPAYSRSSPSGATRRHPSAAARAVSSSVVVGASRQRAAPRSQFMGAPPAVRRPRLALAVQAALWATARARPPPGHLSAQPWQRLCAGSNSSVASVARRGLTCRSTGRATAWHPGRAALAVHVAPRGQGPMPPRAGYLYVRQHMGSGKSRVASSTSARRHSCRPGRAWTHLLSATAPNQFHAARLPAAPCSHPAGSTGCAAGSLSSTSSSPCQRRRALPNMSVNRTRYGMAPWPRCARCPCCASRPGRHASARRLPLR